MIRAVAILLGFQFVGEVATRLGQLPVSGPIFGMAALLAWLLLKGEIDGDLGKVADGILANMALLLVPVGVGAMSYAGLFAGAWPVIALSIMVGAGATLLVTAFVTRALMAWTGRRSSQPSVPPTPSLCSGRGLAMGATRLAVRPNVILLRRHSLRFVSYADRV